MLAIGGVNVVFDPLGFDSYDESFSILDKDRGLLVGYGGNSPTLNAGEKPKSLLFAMAKFYAKKLSWSNRTTYFFYVDRDQKTFVPEFQAVLELVRGGKVEVPIKKVVPLHDVPTLHTQWTSLDGIGSCLVKVD